MCKNSQRTYLCSYNNTQFYKNKFYNQINSVAISSDDKFIVSGSFDRLIKVWELNSGTCIKTLTGHTD